MKPALAVQPETDELQTAIGEIAHGCGRFAVECSDVGGKLVDVSNGIDAQAKLLGQLEEAAKDLLDEQEHVAGASAEAREFAGQARHHLQRSRPVVDGAIETFGGLTDLVIRLGDRMDRLEEALRQVQNVAAGIDKIGRQTNLLALNATLEAARAGDAGRGFAVVASEVKKLASDTRQATERIARTIDQLSREAESIGAEIDAGVQSGGEARSRTAELSLVLGETLDFVDELDGRTADIATRATTIRRNVHDLQVGLTDLGGAARTNSTEIRSANQRLQTLEKMSNGLLDRVSHIGVATADSPFIDLARQTASEITRIVEIAVSRGEITVEQLFDTHYREIAGSDPRQFLTGFVPFADAHVRPIIDDMVARDRRILATAMVDMNGFLPTHISAKSFPQGADALWNAEHCRNRRFFMDAQTAANLKSEADFVLDTYRQDLGGGRYRPVKSIAMPLRILGRRWGNLEFAYLD
jgi:methyl-accepting chemotaxis protein